MSASKTQVLSLVSWLSAGLADATTSGYFYDEVLRELAHDPRAWCTEIASQDTGTIANTSDPSRFEVRQADLVTGKLLAVFYGGRQLSEVSRPELLALNPAWTDEVGEPYLFTRDEEDQGVLRLYPRPRVLPVTGGNLDLAVEDFPIVLYTDVSSTIPTLLALPIALLILSREFERESNHRDLPASEIWKALGVDILTKIF